MEGKNRMTIDEAIKILKDAKITYIAPSGKELSHEALNMAIMALEYMYEDWAEYEEYCKRKESEKEWKN